MTDTETELHDHHNRLVSLEAAIGKGLDGMTLAQLEAMAERLGAAAKTIRDAQALLGGNQPAAQLPAVAAPVALDAAAAHRLRQLQPPEQSSKSQLTAAEQAEKRRHMAQFEPLPDPNLPDDIAALERG